MPADRGKRAGRFGEQMRSLREDEILRAACRTLLHRGCDQFRVEEVAAACGVAKGTCYQHFGSRPALIDAAVRRLDQALAQRLSAPPAHLTNPRQALEWAMFEAIDAELLTLSLRARPAQREAGSPQELPWPCCLGRVACPHAGAAQSIAALRHCAGGLANPRQSGLLVTLLLALAPYAFFEPGQPSRPSLRTIRTMARRLFKDLYG